MTDLQHSILLVDDDRAFRSIYTKLLQHAGYNVDQAADRPEARAAFAETAYDIVLLDLMLPPDGSVQVGLEMLAEFIQQRPQSKIIVVSGAGDTSFMLQAVKQGAYDFLTKPADPDVVLVVVERAAMRAQLEHQLDTLQHQLEQARATGQMIGQSPAFTRAVELARRVAPTDLPVLITGEHGTGKELLAQTIHEHSARAARDFVPINCGALTESLLESTLFGHKKGAFTGATQDRDGLLVKADGGTLFLDEIGDMPPALQVKLLRAIEYGEVLPVGSDHPVYVDVRIVSATNRTLEQMMTEGTFREDLFWRIRGTQLTLPPLRERIEDIPLLAKHFLNLSAPLCVDKQPRVLSEEAIEVLVRHRWPGNMRELRHEMQRASVLSGTARVLAAEDFECFHVVQNTHPQSLEPITLQQKVQSLERREIQAALLRHDQNRTHVARELGLSRQGLLNKMERYGLDAL